MRRSTKSPSKIPRGFWADVAEGIALVQAMGQGSGVEPALGQWFVGGKFNLSYNCVDRHALGARRDKTALIWEGEPGEVRRLTYAELHVEVQKFANALKAWASRRATAWPSTWA